MPIGPASVVHQHPNLQAGHSIADACQRGVVRGAQVSSAGARAHAVPRLELLGALAQAGLGAGHEQDVQACSRRGGGKEDLGWGVLGAGVQVARCLVG